MKKMFNRSLFGVAVVMCLAAQGMQRQDPNMRKVRIVNDSDESYALVINAIVDVKDNPSFPGRKGMSLGALLLNKNFAPEQRQFDIGMIPTFINTVNFNTRRGFCELKMRESDKEAARMILELTVNNEEKQEKVPQGPNEVTIVRINKYGAPKFANN